MRYISLEDARKVIIEKRDKLIDDKPYGWEWEMNGYNGALFAVTSAVVKHPFELIRCKDCKHFETDHFENVNGIPLIVAHEICMRWGDGCKTYPDGYCFMAERKDNGQNG